MLVRTFDLPRIEDAQVVVPAPDAGPGNWSGAPAALWDDGTFVLAYRVRRPLDAGRGVSTVIARSSDGVDFTPVCEVHREEFGAESFERPALARTAEGWRLYLSCATPGSKHWWIEALDAPRLEDLPGGTRTRVLPGSPELAVKDPVVVVDDEGWHLWVCEHPLTEPGQEDRMSSAYCTSTDGLTWSRAGTTLSPRPGTWDARGVRVTAVLRRDPAIVLYDGRPSPEDNWFETTGVAEGRPADLHAVSEQPALRSPHSDGALRYVATVPLPNGDVRYYFEMARPDGAHDLMTALSPR